MNPQLVGDMILEFLGDATGDATGDITGGAARDATDLFRTGAVGGTGAAAVSPHPYGAAMARDRQPTRLTLRMTPQLRDSLRAAADEAGCSVNAFANQVLAAAAGDAARYRTAPVAPVESAAAEDVERDHRGFPIGGRARNLHIAARSAFVSRCLRTMPDDEMRALVTKYDHEDPGYFVEWYQRQEWSTEAS